MNHNQVSIQTWSLDKSTNQVVTEVEHKVSPECAFSAMDVSSETQNCFRHWHQGHLLIWLVVDLPFWKIWKSVGMMKFPIYGQIKLMFQTTNQLLIGQSHKTLGVSYFQTSHYITSNIFKPRRLDVVGVTRFFINQCWSTACQGNESPSQPMTARISLITTLLQGQPSPNIQRYSGAISFNLWNLKHVLTFPRATGRRLNISTSLRWGLEKKQSHIRLQNDAPPASAGF